MSTSNLQVIIEAVDKASEPIKQVGASFAVTEKQMMTGAVAVTAAGAGIEALARKNAPLMESSRKLANSLDMTEAEVRKLATSMSNATFPLDEVFALMEQGRRQGLESAEQLREYAEFWDMVGDATGASSIQMAESAVSLRSLGIEAGQVNELLPVLGFLTRETTIEADEFLSTVERLSPQLEQAGMDVESVAAMLAILESRGMGGRQAMAELRTAMNEGGESFEDIIALLGITEEEFYKTAGSISEYGDVIQENADAHASTMTRMQEMQSMIADLSLNYGHITERLSDFSMMMLAVAPVVKLMIGLKALLAKTSIAAFAAMSLAALPWILLIGAIGVAAWMLYKNWGMVTEGIKGLLEGLKAFFAPIADWFVAQFERVLGWIDKIRSGFEGIKEGIGNFFGGGGGRSSRSVNDAIISPQGDIITTNPRDYLIATTNPAGLMAGAGGINIDLRGAILQTDRDTARRFADEIARELKMRMQL